MLSYFITGASETTNCPHIFSCLLDVQTAWSCRYFPLCLYLPWGNSTTFRHNLIGGSDTRKDLIWLSNSPLNTCSCCQIQSFPLHALQPWKTFPRFGNVHMWERKRQNHLDLTTTGLPCQLLICVVSSLAHRWIKPLSVGAFRVSVWWHLYRGYLQNRKINRQRSYFIGQHQCLTGEKTDSQSISVRADVKMVRPNRAV